MTIFDHLNDIEKMIEQLKKEIDNYSLLHSVEAMGAFSKGFVGGPGTLNSGVFGNVTSGASPFSVGQINNLGGVGAIRSDVFGNVYAGNSPFSFGQINNFGYSGELRSDVFGNVHVGDSPFSSGQL